MWALIIAILKALVEGDIKRLWQQHKDNEALHDQNNVISMSDSELDKRVQSDITRK